MAWNKEDRSFKTLINRRTTALAKNFYEEFGDDTLNVAMREIWLDSIPSNPSLGISMGIVQQYTLFTLTEDISVASQQAYYANSGLPSDDPNPAKPMPLKDWISPKFGSLYNIRLFDNSNNEIFPTNAAGWFWDYQTGILTFSGSTAGFTKPFKITGYRYIGNKGKVVRDIGFNSTSGLGVYYTDGSINYLPVTGGIDGPISGLKSESIQMYLTASTPSIVNYTGLFEDIVGVQFYEVVSSGTNGTAGGNDDVLQVGLLDVIVDQNTKTIIVNPDVSVDGILQIIGTGDITLVGNVTNATTVSRGVVEIATLSEFNAGTDVGGSGAILSVPPSIIKNAIQDVDYLIYPPPGNPFDDYGTIGNWSYDDNFIYYCVPCDGLSGTCGVGGKVWRRVNIEIW